MYHLWALRLLVLLAGHGLALSSTSPVSPNPPTVDLRNGTISGILNNHYGQEFFLGIPYAAPPVGDRRLRKPTPTEPWHGVLRSHTYGPRCMGNSIQLAGFSQNFSGPMSEDCLYLNVIRPTDTQQGLKLPVLVWIHGGGWQEGSASDPRTNGTFLVQESVEMGTPVLFVSLNYRLGAFGMLSGSLMKEAGLTNLALHDQRQALRWIQENIEAFGGDASRVTLMGESAGAFSIGFHLQAYGGRNDGLFSAVIAQSGGPFTAPVSFPNTWAQDDSFNGVLNSTGCAGFKEPLDCLRKVPAEDLNKASSVLSTNFAVDNDIVPDSNVKILEQGNFVHVPLLIGSTRNEGTSFLQQALQAPLNTEKEFIDFMQRSWIGSIGRRPIPRETLQRLAELYQQEIDCPSAGGLGTVKADPGPIFGCQYGKASLWLGDMMFVAGRRTASQAWARASVPCYSYLFDTVAASMDPDTLGASHFMETPYTFGNVQGLGWNEDPFPKTQPLREQHKIVAELTSRMWISFVVTHSPNFHQVPAFGISWPEYDEKKPQAMVFDAVGGTHLQVDNWRAEPIRIITKLFHN